MTMRIAATLTPALFIAGIATAATPCGDCLTEYYAFLQQGKPTAVATLPAFNQTVLELIAAYPTDGTHSYWWPRAGESSYDGVTRDIELDGTVVLRGEQGQRTFCCGLTLEVFIEAYKIHKEKSPESTMTLPAGEMARFKRLWFVEELMGPGPSAALEAYGLGRAITAEEVMPGDFVQLWRHNKSGHSVIFLAWETNPEGEKIGFRYWSTQTTTDGIGEATEFFGEIEENKTRMVWENTHYARVELGS